MRESRKDGLSLYDWEFLGGPVSQQAAEKPLVLTPPTGFHTLCTRCELLPRLPTRKGETQLWSRGGECSLIRFQHPGPQSD